MDALGNVAVGSTIHISFDTHDKKGGRVNFDAAIEAADIRIYKDGGTTERASVAGITVSEGFDSLVGLHQVSIDLSDDTDPGFYTKGSFFKVAIYPDETLDGENVSKWIGSFRIEDETIAKTVHDRLMTEAYAGQGASRTFSKILFNIEAILSRFSWSSGVMTTKKLDNITAAKTYTANDPVDPTGLEETT